MGGSTPSTGMEVISSEFKVDRPGCKEVRMGLNLGILGLSWFVRFPQPSPLEAV
jgi:hypothetical protein